MPPELALYGRNLFGQPIKPPPAGELAEKFVVPPFSVLDARQGYWQERKRGWLALGIQSELGRGEDLLALEAVDFGRRYDGKDEKAARASTFGSGRPATLGNQYRKVSPGVSPRPATAIVSSRARGDGRGQAIPGGSAGGAWLAKRQGDKYEAMGEKYRRGDPVPKGGLTCPGQASLLDGYRVKEGKREESSASGTSIFDPVLCELMYKWFCPAGGLILDPFAGGSVRGIVAAKLGYQYRGIDLSQRQLDANREQAKKILGPNNTQCRWITGDSSKLSIKESVDFVFSCPPYGDLERYSNLEQDLSTMTWEAFQAAYHRSIYFAVQRLKENRFACFVVGNYRNKATGFYRDLVGLTIAGFQKAGAQYYNEAVLLTAIGSLPIRTSAQFASGRKLGKTHQNVLIFCKGDPKKASAACPVEG